MRIPLLAAVISLSMSLPAAAQVRTQIASEITTYSLHLWPFGRVASARFDWGPGELVRGRETLRLESKLEGRVLWQRVSNVHTSWTDWQTGASLRFTDRIREPGTNREDHYEIFPEEGYWENRLNPGEKGRLITDLPLDELAFLPYVRSLGLEEGKMLTLQRHFKAGENPVTLTAERWETVEVPAGSFRALRVRVRFAKSRLFNTGGSATLWLADTPERLLVRMSSDVPILGAVEMRLERVERPESADHQKAVGAHP